LPAKTRTPAVLPSPTNPPISTPTPAPIITGWPTLSQLNGHPVLLVNDRPFFVLGVTDPVGLSLGVADPSPRFPQDFERYFS
jgi:hypothetical protein